MQIGQRTYVARSLHVLRHTFAVTAIQRNISLPAVQRILGHDHLGTTEIYLNLSIEHVLEEYQSKCYPGELGS